MTDHHLSPIARGGHPAAEPVASAHDLTHLQPDRMTWNASEEEEGPGIRGYLAALYRGKWILLMAILVGAGAGYAHGVLTGAIPQYGAQGSLWIQGQAGMGDQGPILPAELLQAGSWRELLVTYAVLDPVVLQERLYVKAKDPAHADLLTGLTLGSAVRAGSYRLRPGPNGGEWVLIRDSQVVDRVAPGGTLGAGMGFTWSPPPELFAQGDDVAFELLTQRDAGRRLREELITAVDLRGTFLTVEYRDPDPDRAAAVVNALMERFVAVAAELKRGNLDENVALLEEQLAYAQEELTAAEQALQTFRIRTITLPTDQRVPVQAGLAMTQAPVLGEFFELQTLRDAARRDRESLEGVLAAIPTSGVPVEAISFIPTSAASAQVMDAVRELATARAEHRALEDRYTSDHPEVRTVTGRIERIERITIPALLSELISQLEVEERQLSSRITVSEGNLLSIPARTIEEGQLERNVVLADDQYQDLRRRYQAATLTRASSLPDVRILDAAVAPNEPVNDDPISIGLLIFLGTIGLAVGVVLVRDRLDSRIRTPDEVMSAFGLPILGAVPRIQGTRGKGGAISGIRNLPQVRESFRQLRTSIEYAYGSAGPLLLTVSSSSMEEGKTLVTTNLGVSFAELGLRTILVDADTRRGDVHHFLGGRRTPGLTDFLMSRATIEEIVQGTNHKGLEFIGSGSRVSNSPELLSSRPMGDLLAVLRKNYDVILVDSPPLGAGADPLVLGSITGHMVFVVRSGSTERDFAQAKLEPLDRLPIRIMGAVLNDYVPDRISVYRHYGTYLPGYEATSELPDREETEERLIAGVGADR